MSTSGTVGTAEGEFVAAGETSWTLPLQLCNSDMERSAKEPVSARAFKVVVRMPRLLNGCSLWLRWCCAIWLCQDIGKIRRGRR